MINIEKAFSILVNKIKINIGNINHLLLDEKKNNIYSMITLDPTLK